ncbi:unnamed protein product [Adineta steineri]|uniref:Uncharacterized protein n=1 Tax=Adineta steineri TaxID=433720 RepID=A0A816DPQ4_9BILA|nr:unnamed protein product [Adineta steineri]CAF1636710.1 unnamed protein product [Adineta steineri]
MTDPSRPPHTGHASEFYMACREGNIDKVNRYLKTMTKREIDLIEESNRSTALHAASYHGHSEVVKRLLELGASTHTHNGYGYTAEQEAGNQATKDVFAKIKK